MSMSGNPRSGVATAGGLALIAVGLWWLLQATGIIPAQVLAMLTRSAGALAVIGLGVAVLVVSRKATFAMPAAGARLYRSRSNRQLGGVLGGLGPYFGIDPTILRIIVVLLTIVGAGALVPAYIVMWVVVPEEPLVPQMSPSPPVPPTVPSDKS